jgi:hypothetical protein
MLFQYEDIEVRVRSGTQIPEIMDIRRYIYLASAAACVPYTLLRAKLFTSGGFSITLSGHFL